jgi:hypothetical protein
MLREAYYYVLHFGLPEYITNVRLFFYLRSYENFRYLVTSNNDFPCRMWNNFYSQSSYY